MLIALYGESCTGKTTIATHLSEGSRIEVRYCGRRVAAEAANQGVQPRDLDTNTHKRIDQETLDWVSSKRDLAVVEGRFLHYVLVGSPAPTVLVRCAALASLRRERMERRSGIVEGRPDIFLSDREDLELCGRLYGGVRPRPFDLCLNTSAASIAECVENVLWKLRKQ